MSFTGEVIGPNRVLLYWRTATEINNDFFQLERSMDGITFQTLGEVPGSGTSNDIQERQFVDNKAITGVNYYRLKQFDFDGYSETSRAIPVNVKPLNTFVTVYPNPPETDFRVSLYYDFGEELTFELMDLQGKKYVLTPKEREGNNYNFNINGIRAGVYILAVSAKENVVYQRLLVQ
jgi:hypothetical protein